MKILHTSDWHLGKRLDSFSRLEEQCDVLDEIVSIADNNNVDVVIISGDLFDNFTPSVEATELFYKTLKRLSLDGKRPVIAIAGNHDSPNGIDAPEPLAKECGIILIGNPYSNIGIYRLNNFFISRSDNGFIEIKINNISYPLRIIHTSYANEFRLKKYLGEDKKDGLNNIIAQHWSELSKKYCDNNGVNILMSHTYMNSKNGILLEEPDGEKPINIGNSDLIYTDCVPPEIQYTALGHLHAFNNIGTKSHPIVYSSSILCYSFSEAEQQKYVVIVNAEPGKTVEYKPIPLTKGKLLVRKSFNNVEDAVTWLQENQNTLVELVIESEDFLKSEERKMIYRSHQGIVHLIPRISKKADLENNRMVDLEKNIDDLFIDYFKSKNSNIAPNKEIMDLFREIKNLQI